MSNIKCDICGGDIEMLPSKVGKCRNCGMEYSLDAIREIVKTNSVTVSPVQSESHMKVKPPSEELNRDALLLYLNDIRVMESVVSESNSKVVDLNEKLKEAKAELSAMSAVKKPVIPVEPSKESIMSDIKDKYFSPLGEKLTLMISVSKNSIISSISIKNFLPISKCLIISIRTLYALTIRSTTIANLLLALN